MFNEVRDCWCFNHECKNRTSESGILFMCNNVKCTQRDSGIDDIESIISEERTAKHEKHSCVFTEFGVEQQGDMW